MNVNASFRWTTVNMLLGSSDNYYASGSNSISSTRGTEERRRFLGTPYFHFIPSDYDNCWGSIIPVAMAVRRYPGLARESGPSQAEDPARATCSPTMTTVRSMDYLEHMLEYEFSPRAITEQIGPRAADGLWTGSGRRPIWNRIHL